MPLVPLETCLFPESLLGQSLPAAEGDASAHWWVLHTRPRSEKSLARRLLGREVAFYLPLNEHHLAAPGRARSSFLPLFPGYIFLFGNDDDRRLALETNLIVQTLPVIDQSRLHEDLQRVHRVIESKQNLTPEQRLTPGTPVQVVAGPLAGLTGTVVKRGKQLRFLIDVRMLQQGVSVEMESWMVEPIDQLTAQF